MYLRVLLVLLILGVVCGFKKWLHKAVVSGIIASGIHSTPVQAFNLFTSNEQSAVNTVASYQKPVNSFEISSADVPNPIGVYSTQQILKGGTEYFNSFIHCCSIAFPFNAKIHNYLLNSSTYFLKN